jgi:hypothetical protein
VHGYLSHEYAAAFAEFGTARHLPRSGGWLIERPIAGTDHRDAMGCYPLFSCTDWSKLGADVDELPRGLVAVSLVTDPFGNHDLPLLERSFDFVRPFKQHFVADLTQDPEQYTSRHHRYYARRSLREARVEVCDNPPQRLDEWVSLYETLVGRHDLRGMKAFSRESFLQQLRVPGIVMLRMIAGNTTVGAQLWFVHEEVAYSHLQAVSDTGYKLAAAYGLYSESLRHFTAGAFGPVKRVDLGAGAGLGESGDDGLAWFKRGWASGALPVYFCGRILDRDRYDAIVAQKMATVNGYFPAYRRGEFS